MKKIVLSLLLSLVMMVGVVQPAYAATDLIDSVGSDSNDLSVGEDFTQNKVTEYDSGTITATNHSQSNEVKVYATKSSWVTISVPKTLILGKSSSNDTLYECSFKVSVRGDIAGRQSVSVTPSIGSNMTEQGGKTSNSAINVTLDGGSSVTVDSSDLLNGNEYTAVGTLTANNITAGIWQSTVNFGVSVSYN